jgi:hypothetical protein
LLQCWQEARATPISARGGNPQQPGKLRVDEPFGGDQIALSIANLPKWLKNRKINRTENAPFYKRKIKTCCVSDFQKD